ncbi:hypothetical protein [Qaidamihabitans albus]|uniref:hypothetical protein n=1 Tax=Qaidamihabitans albus TaxID=2795733 RepID=UPI0018F110B0|nr:hypothetical protein [Qaidamihabitans albus]
MPIDTEIKGSPASIRQAADWFRSTLGSGIHDCVSQIYAARGNSEAEWSGPAGAAFRAKMTSGGHKGNTLGESAEEAGRSFDTYADDLHTAQEHMRRAREIAAEGGLEVTATQIMDPPPAPPAPSNLPGDGSATPEQVAAHNDAVTAQETHAAQVNAYNEARTEADLGRRLWESAKTTATSVWGGLTTKAAFSATDLVNSTIGAAAGVHAKIIRGQAQWLRELAEQQMNHFRAHVSDPVAARTAASAADDALNAADDAARAGSGVARSIGRALPVVGLGITAASIGYDVENGKPPGKAVMSGLAGFGASVAVGAAVGGPVGAVVGVGVGIVASGAADAVYDALPDGVQDGIEAGVGAVGDALGDAAGAVGDAFGSIF